MIDLLAVIEPPGYNTIPGHPAIQWIELFWTLVGLAGAWYAIRNFVEAEQDRRALIAIEDYNGTLKLLVDEVRMDEIIRVVKQFIIVASGVAAMTIEPATPRPDARILITVLITVGLFSIAVLTAYQSFRARRTRLRAKRQEGVAHLGGGPRAEKEEGRFEEVEKRLTIEEQRNTSLEVASQKTDDAAATAKRRADVAEDRADEHGESRDEEHDHKEGRSR